MHKSSKCLEKYAGVILFRPEYAGVSSGVEKIAPDFCRSKKIYSGRNSVWSPLGVTGTRTRDISTEGLDVLHYAIRSLETRLFY